MTGENQSPTSESTSRSLLERARQRDASAWERLSHVYSPLVYDWCRRAGLQSSDAADVAQEVFRSVLTAIDGFRKERPGDSFRGWLWTITRNKIRDHVRATNRRPSAPGGSTAYAAAQQLPDTAPEDSEPAAALRIRSKLARRAMALMQSDFAEHTWRAFWLTTVEEQPPASAARELGVSVATVYQAKSRVLRRLRQELDGLDLLD